MGAQTSPSRRDFGQILMWLFRWLRGARPWGSHGLSPGDSISWTQMGSSRQSPSLPGARFGAEREQVARIGRRKRRTGSSWRVTQASPHPGLPSATAASARSAAPATAEYCSRGLPPSPVLASPPGSCMGVTAGGQLAGTGLGCAGGLSGHTSLFTESEGQGPRPRAWLCRWLEGRQVSETCCLGSGSGLRSAARMEPHTSRSAAGAWPVSSAGP